MYLLNVIGDYYKDELEKDRKMMADIKRQLPDEL